MPKRFRCDRSGEIEDNVERMWRAWADERHALVTVRRFNAMVSMKHGRVWFWPTVGAALTAKHPWLVVACDSCGTLADLDLRMKPRKPDTSINLALADVQCPRCNGHGRPRIVALASRSSI
jgi:hypothetical protein